MENKYPMEERWYDLYEIAIHYTFRTYTKEIDLLSVYKSNERLKEFFEDCQKYELKFPLKKATVIFSNNNLEIDISMEDKWTVEIYYVEPGSDSHNFQRTGLKHALSTTAWNHSAKGKLDSQIRLKKVYMLDVLGEGAKDLKDAPYAIVKSLYDTFTKEEEKE